MNLQTGPVVLLRCRVARMAWRPPASINRELCPLLVLGLGSMLLSHYQLFISSGTMKPAALLTALLAPCNVQAAAVFAHFMVSQPTQRQDLESRKYGNDARARSGIRPSLLFRTGY